MICVGDHNEVKFSRKHIAKQLKCIKGAVANWKEEKSWYTIALVYQPIWSLLSKNEEKCTPEYAVESIEFIRTWLKENVS